MQKARAWGAFVLLSAIWGTSFLFIKLALDDLDPFTLVAIRTGIGVTGLWTIIALTRRRLPRDPRTLLGLLFVGITDSAVPFTLITWGEQSIASGVAGILSATTPLFTLIIAHFALAHERVTPLRLAGLGLGFAGVVLTFGDDLLAALAQMRQGAGLSVAFGSVQGQLAVVAAAACYAIAAVFVRRNMRHLEPLVLAGGSQSASFLLVATSAFLWETPLASQVGARTWFAVGWLGLLGTCVGYILFYFILGQWGATRASLVTYVLPAIAFALGVVVLDEAATWLLFAGGLLIIAGIAIINSKIAQPDTAQAQPALEATS
jgi:drug/metabolite transporter (DMT)-like permease